MDIKLSVYIPLTEVLLAPWRDFAIHVFNLYYEENEFVFMLFY